MYGSSMRETGRARERPRSMVEWDSREEQKAVNPDVHVCGESDVLVGPTKWANKVDEHLDRAGCAPAAESAEERRTTKGNDAPPAVVPTQSRAPRCPDCVAYGRQRVGIGKRSLPLCYTM